MGAASIGLGERSFEPTRRVMEQKGVLPLLAARGVKWWILTTCRNGLG
jgi:hypothetical protein